MTSLVQRAQKKVFLVKEKGKKRKKKSNGKKKKFSEITVLQQLHLYNPPHTQKLFCSTQREWEQMTRRNKSRGDVDFCSPSKTRVSGGTSAQASGRAHRRVCAYESRRNRAGAQGAAEPVPLPKACWCLPRQTSVESFNMPFTPRGGGSPACRGDFSAPESAPFGSSGPESSSPLWLRPAWGRFVPLAGPCSSR